MQQAEQALLDFEVLGKFGSRRQKLRACDGSLSPGREALLGRPVEARSRSVPQSLAPCLRRGPLAVPRAAR